MAEDDDDEWPFRKMMPPKPERAKRPATKRRNGGHWKQRAANTVTEVGIALPLMGPQPRKGGRQTSWTREGADAVLAHLARGGLLADLDKIEDLPSEVAVRQWVVDNRNGFSDEYRRARMMGWDTRAEKLLLMAADNARDFVVDPETGAVRFDGNHVNRHKLMIDTEKWLLGKLRPDTYADQVKVAVDGRVNVQQATTEELLGQVTQALAGVLPDLRNGAIDISED